MDQILNVEIKDKIKNQLLDSSKNIELEARFTDYSIDPKEKSSVIDIRTYKRLRDTLAIYENSFISTTDYTIISKSLRITDVNVPGEKSRKVAIKKEKIWVEPIKDYRFKIAASSET